MTQDEAELIHDLDVLLALDKSLRSYDADGRMHVAMSNISKATVNPYRGSEIPNYKELGLNADGIYMMLRDPKELEAAASTFNNIPLLIIHEPVNAEDSKKELVVGTTGSDVEYIHPFLRCSLAVWDKEGIAAVESGEQQELSSAYHYDPDMTAGTFEGVHYDGVMRNIRGNHVALVDVGRAGRDVVVSDADPFFNRNESMKTLKTGAKLRIAQAIEAIRPKLAQDGEIDVDDAVKLLAALNGEVDSTPAVDEIPGSIPNDTPAVDNDGVVDFLKGKISDEDLATITSMLSGQASDEELDEDDKTANDESPDAPEDGAQKPAQDKAMTKIAMDAAIAREVAKVKADAKTLGVAQKEVAHLVGDVAMDSAAEVYAFALKQNGVSVDGVHPSAYRAMVGMLGKTNKPLGMDSAGAQKAIEQFPQLTRFGKA